MRQDWIASRKRAAEILERFDAGRGLSIRELAGLYHLSYMRVHQIIKAVHGNRRDVVEKQPADKQRTAKRVSPH